jgi:hypothetical protein
VSNSRTDARKGIPMRELTYEEMAMVTGGSVDPKYNDYPWMLSGTSGSPTTGPNGEIGSVGETLICSPSGHDCTVTAGGRGGAGYGEAVFQCFADNWGGDLRDSVMWGLIGGGVAGAMTGEVAGFGVGAFPGAVAGGTLGAMGGAIYGPLSTGSLCMMFPNR